MTLKIVSIGNEGDKDYLNTKCVEVKKEEINEDLRQYINSMWDLMYKTKGVGLAAPQTRIEGELGNVQKRITVIDTSWRDSDGSTKKGKNRLVMINPKIIDKSDEMSYWEVDGKVVGEGCLSVPDKKYKVKRYNKITVSYLDKLGREQEFTVSKDENELLTICIQHELDHLDGVLICDIGEELETSKKKVLKEKEEVLS